MAADIVYNLSTKLDPPERVYLFGGAEETLKNTAVRGLVSALVDPDFKDFDYDEMDAEVSAPDRIISAACTAPFASRRRMVVVRNLTKLKEPEQIASKLESLPSTACLVFLAPPPSDARPKTIISDRFDAAVRKAGAVVQFPALEVQDIGRVLASRAQKLGTPIDRTALNMLMDLAGPELAPLRNELEKLSSFVGEGNRITPDVVELLTPRSPEANVFALVDAVAAGNPVICLATLRGMLDSGERADSAAPKIIGLVARQFRLIAQARYLIDLRYLPGNIARVPAEVADNLPNDPNLIRELGKRSWLLNKVTQQARNFTRKKIDRAFERILETDLAIKGIDGAVEDSRLAMELMLVDLCRIAVAR